MAIARDTELVVAPAYSVVTGSYSFNFTVGSGSDRLILMAICQTGSDADATTISSGPTYNGVALTSYADTGDNGGSARVRVYRLVAPATGTNALALNLSNSAAAGRTLFVVRSYTGVDQTTPLGTAATNYNASADTLSVDVASASGELVTDFFCMHGPTYTATVGAGQSTITGPSYAVDDRPSVYSSDEAGASTTTMSWSGATTAIGLALVGMPLKPVSGGGSPALDDSDGFMLTTIQMPLTAVRLY